MGLQKIAVWHENAMIGRVYQVGADQWRWETPDEATESKDAFSTREEAEKSLAARVERLKNLRGKKA